MPPGKEKRTEIETIREVVEKGKQAQEASRELDNATTLTQGVAAAKKLAKSVEDTIKALDEL